MKLVLIYLAGFSALIVIFFVDHSARTAYVPIPEGLLYSTSVSSQTALNDEVTEKILFKRATDDDYVMIEATTVENLPGKFLVRVIEAKDAKYRLVAASSAAGRPEVAGKGPTPLKSDPGAVKKTIPRPAEQAKAAIAALTVQKEIPQESLNINKVRDIVNSSQKKYYFPGAEKTLNDVSFKVKSITPWQNKSILTIELNNGLASYFFIANISVAIAGAPLPVEIFNEPFINGKVLSTIFVITRPLKSETVTVILSESGGGKRRFELPVSIP